MNLLELYAGSRSVGKVAEKLGMRVFSVDIEPFPGIDLVKDIEFLQVQDIPFLPDIIWASPPCTSYSIAAISYHRNGTIPKSDFAIKSDRLVMHTLELFRSFENHVNRGGGTCFYGKPCGHASEDAIYERHPKGFGLLLQVRRRPDETYGYLEQPYTWNFQPKRVAAPPDVPQREQAMPPRGGPKGFKRRYAGPGRFLRKKQDTRTIVF